MSPSALPKVLVLLAAYNGGRWIRQQLDSILAQQEVDVRIAIRDDGSSDHTREEIARCHSQERIQLSPSRARFGSAAQNFFALMREHAGESVDFIAFADQDDVWREEKLKRACDRLRSTRCSGYSSATLATWPGGRTVLLSQSATPTRGDYLFEGAGQGCTFLLPATFYRDVRSFVIAHPALTQRIHYHDWMVYALARAWGHAWTFDPWPSLAYRQHSDNDTGARGSWASVYKRITLMKSGWYRAQVRAIADVCAAAAPDNRLIMEWNSLLADHDGLPRRLHISQFCVAAGRRRLLDKAVLTLAALSGWV